MKRLVILLPFLLITPALAAPSLTLEDYLAQVQGQNLGVRASQQSKAGAFDRRYEAKLLMLPTVFANVSMSKDQKQQMNPAFSGTSTTANSYTAGVSQLTPFGLLAKASYNVTYINIAGASLLSQPKYHTATPTLELTQSLWANSFGRQTRANQDLVEANAMATHFGETFKNKAQLAEAEATYWRLALAREMVATQKEVLERAQKIFDWSSRRARLNLADKSDMLQARAALEARQLELQSAIDEERSARLAFNQVRNTAGDEVTEELLPPKQFALESWALNSAHPSEREDVKAAEQASVAARSNAEVFRERDRPTLELFGSYALNGKDIDRNEAIGNSTKFDHPTTIGGVRFSTPFDIFTGYSSSARAGYAKEQEAAELSFQKKVFEANQEHQDLNQKLSESRRRLRLVQALEETQKEKLAHEKDRLNRGRTTTYQVLLFEQDYAQAQLTRIRIESEILRLIAQLKTFDRSSS